MNPLRLVIVVPRFWPQVGDVEIFAANLGDEFAVLGARPLVLTGKWAPEWPGSIFVREIVVSRVAHAPRGGWSTFRYMIDLSRWLRQHQDSLDVAYVLGLRHEAYAAVGALGGTRVPVVLRCQGSGPHGDCAWQELARFGERIRRRCRIADAIVSPGPVASQELAAQGYDPDRIHLIPCGAQASGARSPDRRFRARAALADINQELSAVDYAPVVVFAGRLTDFTSLSLLLQVWRDIAARWSSARLWIIGDGSARDALHAQIRDWELQYQVFMPGTFEDLTDVLLAADIFVSPQAYVGQQMVLEAMAAGLPVVAADSADLRAVIDNGRTGMLVPSGDRAAWIAALTQLCENPAAATEMGNAARRLVEQQFSRRRMGERHLELFERLIAAKPH